MKSIWNVLAALSIGMAGGIAGTAHAALTSSAVIQTTGPGPGSNTVTGEKEAKIPEGSGPDQNWGISTIGHIGILATSTSPGNSIVDLVKYSTQITLNDPSGTNPFQAGQLFLSVRGSSSGANAGISAGAHGSSNLDSGGTNFGFGIDQSNGGPTGIFHGSVPAGSLDSNEVLFLPSGTYFLDVGLNLQVVGVGSVDLIHSFDAYIQVADGVTFSEATGLLPIGPPVPEPGSILLLGLAGLATRRRRGKRGTARARF